MAQANDSQTARVLAHHIGALRSGNLDDIMLDYVEQSVVMAPDRSYRGLAEIRMLFDASLSSFPEGFFEAQTFICQDINGDVAFIVWKAEPFVRIGTDTFVIHSGKIATQTFLLAR